MKTTLNERKNEVTEIPRWPPPVRLIPAPPEQDGSGQPDGVWGWVWRLARRVGRLVLEDAPLACPTCGLSGLSEPVATPRTACSFWSEPDMFYCQACGHRWATWPAISRWCD